MDVREKLVAWLCEAMILFDKRKDEKDINPFGVFADHLIAHGVTVQEEAKLYWKPVKPGEWNLTCSACDSHLGCKESANFCPECGAKFVYPKAVAPKLPEATEIDFDYEAED